MLSYMRCGNPRSLLHAQKAEILGERRHQVADRQGLIKCSGVP